MAIYLDNSTLAKPSDRTIAAMIPFYTDTWGSPMAPHKKGQELFPALTQSYRELYASLGASDQDLVIFTSSGAEAVNHVFLSTYLEVTLPTGKNQFVTSNSDEAPALMSISRLERLHCVGKMALTETTGMVTRNAIADQITPRTALVSLSWANGLTGVIQPVAEIAALCQERGILLHLDATHILGKLFFDLKEINPAFISFNGDQLHAPTGTGALFVRHGVSCASFIVGGLEQGGHRAGTFSTAGLVGLAQASTEALHARDLMCTEVARLRHLLEEGLEQVIPGAVVFFKDQHRLPHVTAVGFPGIVNEALLFQLSRRGIYASIGGGSFQQLSLILRASGVEPLLANSAISFSLSRTTTEEEIETTIRTVSECVGRLRQTTGVLDERH